MVDNFIFLYNIFSCVAVYNLCNQLCFFMNTIMSTTSKISIISTYYCFNIFFRIFSYIIYNITYHFFGIIYIFLLFLYTIILSIYLFLLCYYLLLKYIFLYLPQNILLIVLLLITYNII